MTHTGIVKWFSNVKGYGFIEYDETEEIFVHFTGIEMEGYRTLRAGQSVKFKAVKVLGVCRQLMSLFCQKMTKNKQLQKIIRSKSEYYLLF